MDNKRYKATFLSRFLAYLIDGLVILIIQLLLGVLAAIFGLEKISTDILGIILTFSYFVVFTYRDGATLGKQLMKMEVVSKDGKALTLKQVLLREVLGKLISGLVFYLGYVWALFDKDRQTWHDKIAKTYVVTKLPNEEKNPKWIYIVVGLFYLLLITAIIAGIIVAGSFFFNLKDLQDKSQPLVQISTSLS